MISPGSEAVDWLVKNAPVKNRKDAVELGNKLLEKKIFQHVLNEHKLKDKELFYVLLPDVSPKVKHSVVITRTMNYIKVDLRKKTTHVSCLPFFMHLHLPSYFSIDLYLSRHCTIDSVATKPLLLLWMTL